MKELTLIFIFPVSYVQALIEVIRYFIICSKFSSRGCRFLVRVIIYLLLEELCFRRAPEMFLMFFQSFIY